MKSINIYMKGSDVPYYYFLLFEDWPVCVFYFPRNSFCSVPGNLKKNLFLFLWVILIVSSSFPREYVNLDIYMHTYMVLSE